MCSGCAGREREGRKFVVLCYSYSSILCTCYVRHVSRCASCVESGVQQLHCIFTQCSFSMHSACVRLLCYNISYLACKEEGLRNLQVRRGKKKERRKRNTAKTDCHFFAILLLALLLLLLYFYTFTRHTKHTTLATVRHSSEQYKTSTTRQSRN